MQARRAHRLGKIIQPIDQKLDPLRSTKVELPGYSELNDLALKERVEIIRQWDIEPNYENIANKSNFSWIQIKRIIANRKNIMELYKVTRHRREYLGLEEQCQRKLDYLYQCLCEYIQRAQHHRNLDINEEHIREKALEFQSLMGINNFVPDNVSYPTAH